MRALYPTLCGLLVATSGWALPMELKYGVNEVDINADGVKDMIIRMRWENFNAHSFDKYIIMVRLKGKDYPEGVYEVPFGESSPDYKFDTSEGVGCLRRAYVFDLDKKNMLTVTRYAAEQGETYYCEPTKVKVTTFKLTDGIAEQGVATPGIAPFYLKEMMELKTGRDYASVAELVE